MLYSVLVCMYALYISRKTVSFQAVLMNDHMLFECNNKNKNKINKYDFN